MSILLNASTMRSLVNSFLLGGSNYHHHNHHHQHPHHPYPIPNHSKQSSFSSTEIMSTITESSNSSIDSGTFDVFDDPDDHFYDEPLLSSFDYTNTEDPSPTSNNKRSATSVDFVLPSHKVDPSSVIESLLLGSSSSSSANNYKPLTNHHHFADSSPFTSSNNHQQINSHHKQSPSLLSSASSSSSTSCSSTTSSTHNLTSTGHQLQPQKLINKPKLRPPKPPRHINPLTGQKLINSNQLQSSSPSSSAVTKPIPNNLKPLTIPTKGPRSLSTSSSCSSSGVSSSGSPSPLPLTPTSSSSSPTFNKLTGNNLPHQQLITTRSPSPPPLPPPSISKKPARPPPPVPEHPPKPLRKKSDSETVNKETLLNGSLNCIQSSHVNEVTINRRSVSQSTINTNSDSEKESKNQEIGTQITPSSCDQLSEPTMAVLNRSRSSQGSFYETAFDSKSILRSGADNLHRDSMNQLSQHNQHSNRQPINITTYHPHHQHHNGNHSHRDPLNNSSVSSFIHDINSSRSSTASSTASSSSTSGLGSSGGHESSSSSTPKHLDQLAKSILPRRHGIKSSVHIPRSKSSDITLNLSAAASNSSSSPSPVNQIDSTSSSSSSNESKSSSTTYPHYQHQQSSAAAAVGTGAEPFGKRNNPRTKMSSLSTFSMVKSTTSDSLSSLDTDAGRVLTRTRSNLDSLRLPIQERNNRANASPTNNTFNPTKDESINSPSNLNSNCKVTVGEKLPANQSFRRLNLKLDETRSSMRGLPSPKLQSPLTDTRPLDDYDTPWDSNQRLNKVFNKLINTPTTENSFTDCFTNSVNSPKVKTAPTEFNSSNQINNLTNNNHHHVNDKETGNNDNNTNGDRNNLNNNKNQGEPGLTIVDSTVTINSSSLNGGSETDSINQSNNGNNNNNCSSNNNQLEEQLNHLLNQRKVSNGSITHSSSSSYSLNGEATEPVTVPLGIVKSNSSSPIETANSKVDSVATKPERPRKLSLPLNLKSVNCASVGNNTSDPSTNSSALRTGLNLDLCNSTRAISFTDSSPSSSSSCTTPSSGLKLTLGPRKKPLLTFTGQPLPVVSEDIDTTLALEKQGWYHGSITRLDAENLLRNMKEGSYLIRNCESTKQDYSLSLKSVKGFMHMKIVKQSEGKFVLGVFSKPFSSIPEMVKHYSINKLPIRGAEHMSLLYPVIDQLL